MVFADKQNGQPKLGFTYWGYQNQTNPEIRRRRYRGIAKDGFQKLSWVMSNLLHGSERFCQF